MSDFVNNINSFHVWVYVSIERNGPSYLSILRNSSLFFEEKLETFACGKGFYVFNNQKCLKKVEMCFQQFPEIYGAKFIHIRNNKHIKNIRSKISMSRKKNIVDVFYSNLFFVTKHNKKKTLCALIILQFMNKTCSGNHVLPHWTQGLVDDDKKRTLPFILLCSSIKYISAMFRWYPKIIFD